MIDAPVRVLLVEDDEDDYVVTRDLLAAAQHARFVLDWASSYDAAVGVIAEQRHDVYLVDYRLGARTGLDLLRHVQANGWRQPVILLTGQGDHDLDLEAMQAGAADYLIKGRIDSPLLERSIRYAQERMRRVEAQEVEGQVWSILAHVGQEMIGALDTPGLLDKLCQITTQALGCDWTTAFLWRAKDAAYSLVASHGIGTDEWGSMPGITLLKALMVAPPDRLVPNETEGQSIETEGRAVLFVRLRRRGETIGLLACGWRDSRRRFMARHERVAGGISQLGSMAMENARLFDELARANRLKSDFVSTMSHELRTPLHVITGYCDLLLTGEFGRLGAEQAEILRRVRRSTGDLFELVRNTLDLSRLEAGQLPVQLQDVVLPDLLDELDVETADIREKPGVVFVWEVAPDVPALYTDPLKLKVVLKNLLFNAFKFTQEGQITLTARPAAGGVVLAVSDTGIGVPPDALPYIFDCFRQADASATRRFGGVGLGLYIVRRLLDLLGGTVEVDSEVGAGSTFRVWIPRHAATPSEARIPFPVAAPVGPLPTAGLDVAAELERARMAGR